MCIMISALPDLYSSIFAGSHQSGVRLLETTTRFSLSGVEHWMVDVT